MDAKVSSQKRTRAKVYRDQVKVRLASGEAGLLIGELLKKNGIEFPVSDWSEVSGHWLAATLGDRVIACLMVVPARPIGLLEFLFSDPTVSFKFRVIAMQKLALQGVATLLECGSSYLSCMVDKKNKAFYAVLGKYGFVQATEAAVMVKRLKGLH